MMGPIPGPIPTAIIMASPICRGSGMAVPSPICQCRGSGVHPHRHPRFAGDRGSIPTAIPDLPESGIQLSTIDYCKGVEFRLPQCLTLRLIVLPKLINLRRPAMSDDAVDYSGTSDSDSESDKVPLSTGRLPARAESCTGILAHDLSDLHAGFGCAPSSPE